MDDLNPEGQLPFDEIAEAYGLVPPIEARRIASGRNELYRLRARGEVRILKLYHAGRSARAQVDEELAALHHLGDRGISVALPIAGRDGKYARTLVLPGGERQVVLYEPARGVAVSILDAKLCRLFGRALAAVHTATDDFAAASVRLDLEHLLERPLRALEPLLEARAEDREFLRGLAERLRARFAALPEGALDWGYCHGDFRPDNAHLADETALTLFGFEYGGLGYRAYDLATFVYGLGGGGPADTSERLRLAFLGGYAERRRISSADRDAVTWLVAVRPIHLLGDLLQTSGEDQGLTQSSLDGSRTMAAPAFLNTALLFLRAWERQQFPTDDRSTR